MNQEEVFAMAKAAGMDVLGGVRDNGESSIYFEGWPEQLAAFAALVAAKEREACALVCDRMAQDAALSNRRRCDADALARSIRARGTKDGV